jgi:glucose-6-phosphate dehydrogenase assembly protein OpcA
METSSPPGDTGSGARTEAFLSGQGIPVALTDIENQLTRLWGPSATRADGPEVEHPSVTRVSLANLVVVCLDDEPRPVEEALDTVVALHPCRVIQVRGNGDPERRISAEVAAHCQLPTPGHPQVCSERIILGVGPSGHDLLPGAVRPLLESDLPMIVWWASDPSRDEALRMDLADEASRMLIDLPDPNPLAASLAGVLALDRGCECTRDLAWFGTDRWRELVAQFFDAPGAGGSLARLRRVEIRTGVPLGPQPARVGAWLAAWLAGRLAWEPRERHDRGSDVDAVFDGPQGAVEVSLRHEFEPGLPFAEIREVLLVAAPPRERPDDVEERLRVHRVPGSDHARIETSSGLRCALDRMVRSPGDDQARRVAAALTARRSDRAYSDALPHALWLLGG